MKKAIVQWFAEILMVTTMYVLLVLAWQGLELLIYGQIQPRYIDDFIAIALVFSVYKNLNIKVMVE